LYSYKFKIFHSPCLLIFHASTKVFADEVARIIYQYAKRLEEKYSFFAKDSELSIINNRKKRHIIVSDEFAGLLALSAFYYKKTSSCFDIAYAGTMHDCLETCSMQEYEYKSKILLPYAKFSHLHVDANSIEFSNDYTKLDLGGLVKEYAVDQSVLLLKQLNITSALIDFGGDIAAFGTYDSGKWKIGIQDPDQSEHNLMSISLDKAAVCTSGHSKSFYMIGDTKISHIISKKKSSHKQVSILAPTAIDAGIWSTSLLVDERLKVPNHVDVISLV